MVGLQLVVQNPSSHTEKPQTQNRAYAFEIRAFHPSLSADRRFTAYASISVTDDWCAAGIQLAAASERQGPPSMIAP
jgi:hypothetical protein